MKKLIAVMVVLFVSAGLMFSASEVKENGKKSNPSATVVETAKDKAVTNAASVDVSKEKKAKKMKKVKKTKTETPK